jgi:hypothetical protein
MVYRKIIAVCSQIHTKQINTLCGQNVELLNVKLAVHIVITGLLSVKRHSWAFTQTQYSSYQCHKTHYLTTLSYPVDSTHPSDRSTERTTVAISGISFLPSVCQAARFTFHTSQHSTTLHAGECSYVTSCVSLSDYCAHSSYLINIHW